jgi:hypothetical protein
VAAATIRIDDLRAPVLSDTQRAALEFGEAAAVDLSVDAVLGRAMDETGLDDFGRDDFRERLALWLAEVDEDPSCTGLARVLTFGDCVRHASNRLRIRDLLRRQPEIDDIQIRAPIVVVGLPRSGTTHLVNLIAADDRLRSMPLWESQEPVPGEGAPAGGEDPRFTRSRQRWEAMRSTAPLLAAMHPMNPEHVHEEIELQLPDFASYNQEWVARAPRWRDYYLAHDQTPHYSYMRTALKILQWYRPRDRWVLKSPQHLEQIPVLMRTFPDATVVVTHRDPVSVVQSAATMLAYGARMKDRIVDPAWYLEYWTDRIHRLLEASVRDRDALPAGRTVDVFFHEFMADDVATVERIYAAAGLEMDDAARSRIERYLAEHPRGKDGQVVYDLRRDFGAEPSAVRERFGFYLDRFPVRIEVE